MQISLLNPVCGDNGHTAAGPSWRLRPVPMPPQLLRRARWRCTLRRRGALSRAACLSTASEESVQFDASKWQDIVDTLAAPDPIPPKPVPPSNARPSAGTAGSSAQEGWSFGAPVNTSFCALRTAALEEGRSFYDAGSLAALDRELSFARNQATLQQAEYGLVELRDPGAMTRWAADGAASRAQLLEPALWQTLLKLGCSATPLFSVLPRGVVEIGLLALGLDRGEGRHERTVTQLRTLE